MPTGLFKKAETVKSLARRNGVTVNFINDLVAKGMLVESEHSKNHDVQRTIAIQHLSESLDYYKELGKMEKKLHISPAFEKGGNLAATPAGGAIEFKENGKTVIDSDGTKGGIFKGQRHSGANGGIDGNVDGSSQVKVETDEALIIPEAVNKPGIVEFEGQKMTQKEVISKINTEAGGVPIKKAGGPVDTTEGQGSAPAGQAIKLKGSSVVITRNAVLDNKKRDFNGEQLTNREILSRINQSGGGAAFEEGGNLPGEIMCGGGQFSYGGKMMYGEQIAGEMNNSCGCQHSMEKGGPVEPNGLGNLLFSNNAYLQSVLERLELVKPKLKGIVALAYRNQPPENLLKYVQEQATGLAAKGSKVGDDAYNTVIKMLGGDEELVQNCISLLPQSKKQKVIDHINKNKKKYAINLGLTRALLTSPPIKDKDDLKLTNIEKAILASVYKVNIEGKKGVLAHLSSSASDRYYFDNNLSKSTDVAATQNEIDSLSDDITFLYANGYPYTGDRHDADVFLRDLNSLIRTNIGKQLLGDEKYYNAYIDVFNKIESYFQNLYPEKELAKGGEVEKAYEVVQGVIKFNDKQSAEDIIKQYPVLSTGYSVTYISDAMTSMILGKELPGGWYATAQRDGNKLPMKPLTLETIIYYEKEKEPEVLTPEILDKQYPDRPLTMADIPESVKVFMPAFQQKAIVGSEEHWEVVERLAGIIKNMPKTYQTENTPIYDKIVYLHYFYGGSDWYIVEKDREKQQLQAFGYAILNQDYEMAEWGYISIEELKSIKMMQLDFYFEPIKFGELQKKWNQEEKADEKPRLPEPVPDTFVYGLDWNVPESHSDELLKLLQKKGFQVLKKNGTWLYLEKNGNQFFINDNGGEFNLGDRERGEHIANVPYSINDNEIVPPDEIVNDITNFYADYYYSHKEEPVTTQPSSGVFSYGQDYGTPEGNAQQLITELRQNGFGIIKINGKSLDVLMEGGHKFIIIDRGSEFELIDFKTRESIGFIPYIKNNAENVVGGETVSPRELVEEMKDRYSRFYSKAPETEDEFEAGAQAAVAKMNVKIDQEAYITPENPTKKEVAADPDAYSANEAKGESSLVAMFKGKKQSVINDNIRALLKKKGADRSQYSADELAFIKLYEGAGGLAKEGETGARLFDQFFTPMDICGKMWGIALKYGFNFKNANILEPAVGSGRFLQFIPHDQGARVMAYDVDETSYTLCKVLFPDFDIRHGSFEEMFFKGSRHIGLAGVTEPFDLVIGNPPYRDYISKWAPLGEKDATGASTFEMYFIGRGVDVLKPGGLLIMIIPNSFLSNKTKYNDFKDKLMAKADFLEAFRLPNGVFGNTDVGTDILVLRKK